MKLSNIPFEDRSTENIWGGVFFHPLFIEPAREALNLHGSPQLISIENNPVFISNLITGNSGGIRRAALPLLFQYYGIIPAESNAGSLLADDAMQYFKEKCDFAYFSFTPDFPIEVFADIGWIFRKQSTMALRGDELSAWGNNFRDDVKNKIRKAGRESVHIEEIESLPDEIWSTVFSRRKLAAPISPKRLRKWCDSLMKNSLLKIYAAFIDRSAVAFRGELFHGKYAYDWIAGSLPEFHSTGCNQLLMAEIGSNLKSGGCETWDLVGGGLKGIDDFKKSFGAREYDHYHGEISFNMKGRLFSVLRKLRHAR